MSSRKSRFKVTAVVVVIRSAYFFLLGNEKKLDLDEGCGFEIGCEGTTSKRWLIPFCEPFNTAKGALSVLSIAAIFETFSTAGLINVVISTLEKRFNLRSAETGLIASSFSAGAFIPILIVTYFGGRGHKPIWIGWGVVILALASLLFALPHFLASTYTPSGSESFQCEENLSRSEESSNREYRWFFILAQLMFGIGVAPLYSLGLTYLDENVKQRYSSTYHGIYYSFSIIGSGAGAFVGAYLLSTYTNMEEEVAITQENPEWVGNWWLGFLLCSVALFLVAIPILMYPRQIPGTASFRKNRSKEMHDMDIKSDENKTLKQSRRIRDAPRITLLILKNPAIIFISLGGGLDLGIVASLANFGPKAIESVYALPASTAAFYFGVAGLSSATLGQLCGGVIVSKFGLNVRRMMKMSILFSVLTLLCFFVFFIHYENLNIHGVIYFDEFKEGDIYTNNTIVYDPVCGSDDLTYLSFCHAGCNKVNSSFFENCTTVQYNTHGTLLEATATKGKCETLDRSLMGFVLLLLFMAVIFIFLLAQPTTQASIRCVPFDLRSYALGVQWFILRVFGIIPLSMLMGKVIDLSCVIWSVQFGEFGSCKVYDSQTLMKYLGILTLSAKSLAILFYILASKTYKVVDPAKLTTTSSGEESSFVSKS